MVIYHRSGASSVYQATGHVMRPRGRRLIFWVSFAIAFQAIGTLVALYWWSGVPIAKDWAEEEHHVGGHEAGHVVSTPPPFSDFGLHVAEANISHIPSKYRTLWTAGWNARFPMYFRDSPPVVSWDSRTEAVFESEWRRLQFPDTCNSVNG